MSNTKLVDPVEGQTRSKELEEFEDAVDIDGLDLSDFSVPEQKYTQKVHPFEGYPHQMKEIVTGQGIVEELVQVEEMVDEEKITETPLLDGNDKPVLYKQGPNKGKPKIRKEKTVIQVSRMVDRKKEVLKPIKQKINATNLVAMNPTEHIHQDPSGHGHQLKKSGRIVNLKTFHNRVVVNTDNKRNIDIVFDRELYLNSGKKMQYAIVINHGARAQLIFFYDAQKKKVQVDKRYMLLDKGQMSRLRKTFDQYNYQQMKAERLSKQFDAEEESTADDKG